MKRFSPLSEFLSVICMTDRARHSIDAAAEPVYTVNMPVTKTPDTRERIANATRRLFDRHGLDGVSMRRVAQEVGVTAPAIYRHYRGRVELLEEITGAAFDILVRRLEKALDEPGTPLERILRLFDCYLEFAVEQPRYFDFLFLEWRPNLRSVRELSQPDASPTAPLLIAEVEAAMEAGELRRDDVRETCLALWGQAHGLLALHRAGRFHDDLDGFQGIYRRSLRRLVEGLAP
jgi:AcrR family transcriptional regulator